MTAPRLTPLQWLICAIAALGFAFDIYEVLMAPLVVGPAIGELTGFKPGTPDFNFWVGMFFWVPALVGGAFGLLGGYLTDRFGRRRVLVWSILIYAFSAMAAGFATNIEMLLILRSTTYIGVFVEFVAAVAWIAEIFPDAEAARTRAGLHAGVLVDRRRHGDRRLRAGRHLRSHRCRRSPAGHAAWRYTLISGVIPALPLIVIRPFLPESPAWQEKKAAGTLRAPVDRRAVHPGAAPHDDRHDDDVRVRVRRGVRRHPADAAHRARPARGAHACRRRNNSRPRASCRAYQEVGGLVGRFAARASSRSASSRGES